ncbi:MAG: ribosome maturation factor RimM [Gammaproteobacteria bacterium]|nr:ribosome maturation factor RimM [Gammaproteobacteria bacterium]
MIVVGRITGVYGVRGWVRLASFTDPVDNLLDYRPWLLEDRGQWREVVIDEVRPHGKGFVARIDSCEDRDEAARFAGRDLCIPADRLPAAEEDEYYWFELEGLKVVGTDGIELGRVDHLFATGANDVMVVKDGTRERLLPFIADVIVEVDRSEGLIRVDWDPEL